LLHKAEQVAAFVFVTVEKSGAGSLLACSVRESVLYSSLPCAQLLPSALSRSPSWTICLVASLLGCSSLSVAGSRWPPAAATRPCCGWARPLSLCRLADVDCARVCLPSAETESAGTGTSVDWEHGGGEHLSRAWMDICLREVWEHRQEELLEDCFSFFCKMRIGIRVLRSY
jgi:hypothetical protein